MGKKRDYAWEGILRNMVRQVAEVDRVIPEQCKFCGSKHIVGYGRYRGVQRWWCKDCKRKFVHNNALPRMRTPIIQVASALSMFYEGMSLHGIRRYFEQTYRSYPSNAAIYYWVVRFTKLAIKLAKDYKPNVGDVWVADETVLKIEGDKVWFWDIICARTRFLLASHMSHRRTTYDARVLLARAARRAEKPPKTVITDRLQAYRDGIELNFGADTKHITAKGLGGEKNIIERFHGTLKARTKVMRGLKTLKSSKLIIDGWLVHYNFFRPHLALGDKTPAQKSGITFPFKNWLDIVKGGNFGR